MNTKYLPSFSFRPRLLESLKHYTRTDLAADIPAGITVGVVALPLALAFGIASGVRPEQGLMAAVIGGFIVSALGGSKVQIGGPAGAFVALMYAIAEKYGVANLLIATIMAGVLLFAMGALKLGNLVRFIPVSIIIGFTAGIAVIIGLSQVKDVLGLAIDKMPSNFFSQLSTLGKNLHTVNPAAVMIALSSFLLILLWPVSYQANASRWRRIVAKLPSTLIVLIVPAVVVWFLDIKVETIGSKFGALPQGLPMPQVPSFDWATAQNLVAPTIAIALLAAIESLLCARMADGMIDDRHDPNQELMAQGIANFFSPWFGGIAVTGTIARTVTNIRTGGRTPVAGMVHALVLLVVLVAAAPLAAHIPLAALAAILLWVAFNMADWSEFARLKQFSMFYRVTLVSTFLLTVIFDLVVAVEVGLVLSSLFFIYRISTLTKVDEVALPPEATTLPDGRRVGAWTLYGSLFFGSVTKLENLLDPGRKLPDIVILEMDHVINLDTTGLDALTSLLKSQKKHGGELIIAGAQEQPYSLMARGGFVAAVGEGNVVKSLNAALMRAEEIARADGPPVHVSPDAAEMA
ncbi:MAG: SulP family inorganic anion transporter [Burkholderiales bacterium]|nr:SulP family inorganic anion transporter [Burkholderiales bacterium]